MYSPNVKFEVPDVCARVLEVKDEDKNGLKKIDTSILEHHFNSKVILHLPNTSVLPSALVKALVEGASFYSIKDLPVHELCDYKFIQDFVQCGKVYAYSTNTRLDVDNCAAFAPHGSLFLLVDNFTYHELGIVGKLSSHILRRPANKYFVEVNTKAPGFISRKNLYQRTHRAFNACQLSFDFHMVWKPNDKNVCPSSIAKYFHDLGYTVKEIDAFTKQSLHENVSVPQIINSKETDDGDFASLLEWLGALAMDVDTDILKEITPEPSSLLPLLNITHLYGLYAPSDVNDIVNMLRNWMVEQDSESVPWICITVFGPPDGLISWAKTENSFKTNGENFFTIVVFRDRVIFYTIEESKKPQRFFIKSSNK